MRSTLATWIIQLKPLKPKLPVTTRRMQQELRDLALRAGVDSPSTDAHIARVTQRDRTNGGDGLRPAVPCIPVLVDGRWERRDVELVGGLAPERPGCALCGIGVDVELQLAP